MRRFAVVALAATLAASFAPAVLAKSKKIKSPIKRGTLKAEKAGWLLGMYVGIEEGKPYPFVIQVDRASDAKMLGIKPGDELIRWEGKETMPLWHLFDMVNDMPTGQYGALWIRRGAETLHYDMRIPRERNAPPAEDQDTASSKEDKGDSDKSSGDKKSKGKKKEGPVVIKPIPGEDTTNTK